MNFDDYNPNNPWELYKETNTCASDWAEAFCASFPDKGLSPTGVTMWFLLALRSGHDAGGAHYDFPEA